MISSKTAQRVGWHRSHTQLNDLRLRVCLCRLGSFWGLLIDNPRVEQVGLFVVMVCAFLRDWGALVSDNLLEFQNED